MAARIRTLRQLARLSPSQNTFPWLREKSLTLGLPFTLTNLVGVVVATQRQESPTNPACWNSTGKQRLLHLGAFADRTLQSSGESSGWRHCFQ